MMIVCTGIVVVGAKKIWVVSTQLLGDWVEGVKKSESRRTFRFLASASE
jgi:hypothetical protein